MSGHLARAVFNISEKSSEIDVTGLVVVFAGIAVRI
jgi:hypothetical protein